MYHQHPYQPHQQLLNAPIQSYNGQTGVQLPVTQLPITQLTSSMPSRPFSTQPASAAAFNYSSSHGLERNQVIRPHSSAAGSQYGGYGPLTTDRRQVAPNQGSLPPGMSLGPPLAQTPFGYSQGFGSQHTTPAGLAHTGVYRPVHNAHDYFDVRSVCSPQTRPIPSQAREMLRESENLRHTSGAWSEIDRRDFHQPTHSTIPSATPFLSANANFSGPLQPSSRTNVVAPRALNSPQVLSWQNIEVAESVDASLIPPRTSRKQPESRAGASFPTTTPTPTPAPAPASSIPVSTTTSFLSKMNVALTSTKDGTPTNNSTPGNDSTPANDSIPADDSIPTDNSIPTDDSSLTNDAASADNATPANDATPANNTTLVNNAAPTNNTVLADGTIPENDATPAGSPHGFSSTFDGSTQFSSDGQVVPSTAPLSAGETLFELDPVGSKEPGWSVPDASTSAAPIHNPRLGSAEKALKKRTKPTEIKDAVAQLVQEQHQQVVVLANKLGVDTTRILKLMGQRQRVSGMQEPSAFQAAVSFTAELVNADLLKGHKKTMKEIQDMVRADAEMMREIERGDKSEKVLEWKQHVKDKRTDKYQVERASGKAQANDATKTYNKMKFMSEGVELRDQALTFGFIGRSSFSSSVQLSYYGHKSMEEFMMSKFKMTCFEFCQAAESWCCLAKAGEGKEASVDSLKTAIAGMILTGLRNITGRTKLSMEYKYYHTKIVRKYHVLLVDWPEDVPFANAHQLNYDQVKRLYDLLRSRVVHWKAMTAKEYRKAMRQLDDDIKAGRILEQSRKRKNDSTQTTSRKRPSKGKSDVPTKRRKTGKQSQVKQKKGKTIMDEDSEEEEEEEDELEDSDVADSERDDESDESDSDDDGED
ncbi:hypothetical protein VKT23_019395 [Stygiomarasmius scandens]|uniref:Uncharacterized protein n=1 Tax=Marasmiellus scandens TaxID=2682957 RepID=A0ABR1INS6_9AGAR